MAFWYARESLKVTSRYPLPSIGGSRGLPSLGSIGSILVGLSTTNTSPRWDSPSPQSVTWIATKYIIFAGIESLRAHSARLALRLPLLP